MRIFSFTSVLLLSGRSYAKYTLPQFANDSLVRAATIELTRAGFTYGEAVAGGPFYPSGLLGYAKTAADIVVEQTEALPQVALAELDGTRAALDQAKYNGLKTLDDYTKLYSGEWTNTLPEGPVPGVLTNYTEDLLFSMERLSVSPYAIRRLDPSSSDTLAFEVDDAIVTSITGLTLRQLLAAGRLFYADHSDQAGLERTERYAAACDAYFYICPSSGDFLPLAIRTGVGSSLVYTPRDSAADWLLAKIMYNVNDFWFSQLNHLAATHEVIQIVWMAAIRTLSISHPVYGLLNRLTYALFSINPVAQAILLNKGAAFDSLFGYTGAAAGDYVSDRYFNGSGAFQANYFLTDLRSRGLIDSAHGPELSHFPFYEDASVIHGAIRRFMADFVASYYTSSSAMAEDTELRAWVAEANGAAEVIDFPSEISSTDTLVDVLTHIAHLGSTAHHTVNTNELLSASWVLPFHPGALYAPLPTAKSANTSVVSFLPPLDKADGQLTLAGFFSRPLLAGTNRTLAYMFDDPIMLAGMNSKTAAAAVEFQSAMLDFSDQVAAREFDADGLCQGMPFVWQALDPRVALYSVTI